MRKLTLILWALVFTILSTNVWAATFVASPKGRVVVIDPGHGGPSRPGAIRNSVNEKDLNLTISLEVRRQLAEKMPKLEVFLTRESDKELHPKKENDNLLRPKLANQKQADLFVSIHANDFESDRSVHGVEIIVLSLDGATQGHTKRRTVARDNEDFTHIDNIDKNSMAYIEALSLLMNNDPINRTFGEIVSTKFKAIGRKSRGIKVYPEKVWTVLYPLRGPGVIIEVGFMTNAAELEYMNSKRGQQQIAGAISDAIVEYMKRLDQMTVEQTTTSETGSESVAVKESAAKSTQRSSDESVEEGYTIQLMASATHLSIDAKRFGSLHSHVAEFTGKGTYKYKYCYGRYSTLAEAKSALAGAQERFADAYIVQYRGGNLK